MVKNIEEQLKVDFRQSLLAGRSKEAEALRYLISILQKQASRKPDGKLSEVEKINLLQKELKTKQEALTLFQKAGREELVKQEEFEIKVLKRYLPKMLSPQKINQIIQKVLLQEQDFGKVMAKVMVKLKGKAAADQVVELVKQALSQQK